MALIKRRCMKKGCDLVRRDRTWFDENYWEENPFLCKIHLSETNINPEDIEKIDENFNIVENHN